MLPTDPDKASFGEVQNPQRHHIGLADNASILDDNAD